MRTLKATTTVTSRSGFAALVLAATLALLDVMLPAALAAQQQDKRPVELGDVLAWKSIRGARLSNDGKWFTYSLVPVEGNGETVVRSTTDGTEYRFPIGEAGSGPVVFSDDSRWLAFTIFPDRETKRRNQRQRKPSHNSAGLVDLSTGKMTEFEGVQGFAFDGERSAWIGLHKYAPAAAAGASNAAPADAGGDSEGAPGQQDRARGSDLVLHELATGTQMSVGNVAEFAFDEKGERVAWIVDSEAQTGNGVQLRNMVTGVVRPLDSGEARYRQLTWTDDPGSPRRRTSASGEGESDGLTVLKGVSDDNYEDMLYSVIGFLDLDATQPAKTIYDPQQDSSFPAGMTISPNRAPIWTDSRDALLFGIARAKKKEPSPAAEDSTKATEPGDDQGGGSGRPQASGSQSDRDEIPDLVLWHWKDPRLQSQQQVEAQRDRNFSFLAVYRVREKRFIRLADEKVDNVTPASGHRWAVGYDNSGYELMGNLDGRRYQDIHVIDMQTGERKPGLGQVRWSYGISPDESQLLYYQDGHFHVLQLATGRSRNITRDVRASFINSEDDHNIVNPPISPIGWVKGSKSVLLYDNWDIWKVDLAGGPGVNLTVNGRSEQIRYRSRISLDPAERDDGIDLAKDMYVRPYGEWTKKSGFGRIRGGKPGVEMLSWEDAALGSGFGGGLVKAEDAEVFAYTRATPADFPDYYVTDASFKISTRLTQANPQQKDFLWTAGSRLVDYTCEKGERAQASLFLPANYEPGKAYPTIVYFYEKMSQQLNDHEALRVGGFNRSFYTSHGYAVLNPDIYYHVNDPGMSAVWCMVPAVKAAIATGIVDPERVGITGHSWGGYQTSHIVTQTDLFKAAIAGAPLTNMVSMYSSIYWNSGGADGAIFESSQGRFTSHFLDETEAYIRNSPVFFANRVKTPLVILHNDRDGAVDWNQGIEYYNILRRLGKPVVMLQYVGENHGVAKPANQKDYTIRMKEFFDHHLKGAPAPAWWEEGLPHLDKEERLKERVKQVAGP